MRQAWMVLALAGALAFAGCLADEAGLEEQSDPGEDATADDAPDRGGPGGKVREDEETFTHEESGAADRPEWTPVRSWIVGIPGDPLEAEVSLSADQEANDWRLAVRAPDETTHIRAPPGESEAEASFDDPAEGSYELELQSRGARVPDEVDVTMSYAWKGADEATGSTAEVQYERVDGDQWKATIAYGASADPADEVQVDARTFNGPVELATAGDATDATVEAWGRADTKERARELASDVEVALSVTPERVDAEARAGDAETDDDEGQGADVAVETPSPIRGQAGTSNGPIGLQGLEAGSLTAETANGPIEGTVAAARGDLSAVTSNGPIDLEVEPTTSLQLRAETQNGEVDLGLVEGDDIGYEISATTQNGRISEDMEEADLEDRDQGAAGDEATLRTQGYGDRAIQVQGPASTSNGPIHFQGR